MIVKRPRSLWLWALLALILTQLSLWLAVSAHLTILANHGISFGLLAHTGVLPTLLETAGVVVVLLAAHWWPTKWVWPEAIAIGGAIGNLLDRLVLGAVPDPLHIAPYPYSFNLADVLIRLGLVVWLGWLAVAALRRRSAQRP
jgi:lipoprotein signal peptidase